MREIEELARYVQQATVVYRKGEEVSTKDLDGITVVTIDAFPALPEGTSTVVDCHFVSVGFTEGLASLTHEQFKDLILRAAPGEFSAMMPQDWAGGPSYINIGGWIGDQTLAFQFMACCVAHGLADKVITPAFLHITGAEADQLAGMGMVMLAPMQLLDSVVGS